MPATCCICKTKWDSQQSMFCVPSAQEDRCKWEAAVGKAFDYDSLKLFVYICRNVLKTLTPMVERTAQLGRSLANFGHIFARTRNGSSSSMVYASRFHAQQPNALLLNNVGPKQAVHRPPNWPAMRRLIRSLSSGAWELALKFGQSTTIHGLNRLFGRSSGKYERSIWFLTVLLALLGAIYVCHILSERFTEGKLETVVDSTRMPVYRIVFPVVTICNLNALNWQRLEEAKRRFLPSNSSPEKERLFERVIATYDGLNFVKFADFAVLNDEPLEQLRGVNFSLVVDFMTWRCEEMLTQCVWNHFPMNCCEIFSKRRSKNGLCWSFNTLETEEGRRMQKRDPMWPWHTSAAGPGSGLLVRVLMNLDKHVPNRINEKGISVMITEPYVWHKDPMTIPHNTYTMVEVDPVIYFYDNNTRTLSSKLRQCVFYDEQNSNDFKTLQGYVYMIENCQSECHQEYLMRFCNCTVDLLFPPGQYPSCQVTDLPCLARNNERFRYSRKPDEEQYVRSYTPGMLCECFRNCFSLNYLADARPSYVAPEIRGNLSYVDLDVHFRFETMMVYRTSLIFGWVDLMVAFGGIAGLFLGCSLISTMELAYFLFVDVPSYWIKKLGKSKQVQKQRKLQQKPSINNSTHYMQQLNVKNQHLAQQQLEHLLVHGRQQKQFPDIVSNWPQPKIINKLNHY